MNSQIALILWALGICGLFYLERERKIHTSWALWLPVTWIFIAASRAVSQWLGGVTVMDSPDQYLEGSPLDRAIFTGILVAGVFVLIARRRRTVAFLRANKWMLLFFLYCLASVLWSDFPLVAFKRWTKFLGNVTMVLIVLTDTNPTAALKRLFAWTGFLLVPLSLLLIKFYPALGRTYSRWDGTPHYTGVATDKNGLGVICLIWGLVSLWQFVEAYRAKKAPGRRRALAVQGLILAIVLWLFHLADSSTAVSCFAVGSCVLLMSMRMARRWPAAIHALVAVLACLALVPYLFADVWASVVHSLGRQTDLTGRTNLWKELLQFNVNPLVGTGFESFWLGARARHFWEEYYWHPNQAHNGYLETYLNLGWIGVVLLVLLMAIGYRNITQSFRRKVPSASLMLSFWIITITYNLTEATFKLMHPAFVAFLFAVTAVPTIRFHESRQSVADPCRLAPDPTTEIELPAFEAYKDLEVPKSSSFTRAF